MDFILKNQLRKDSNRLQIEIDWMIFADKFPDLAELVMFDPKQFHALLRERLFQTWRDSERCFENLRIWIRPYGIPADFQVNDQPYQTQTLQCLRAKIIAMESNHSTIWSR